MDLSKLTTDPNGFFPLLDLYGEIESVSDSSICLDLRRATTDLSGFSKDQLWALGRPEPEEDTVSYKEIGWIDVHYPSQGIRKIFMRMNLPVEYHDFDRLEQIKTALLNSLSIPDDLHCVVYFFTAQDVGVIVPKDQLGMG